MPKREMVLVFLCTAIVSWSVTARAGLSAQARAGDLTVHEWGTFTTVAGEDGRAVEWLPLSGPVDLPCFVYHYQNDPLIKLRAGTWRLDYENARSHLRGRVRMETPVLYFYSSGDIALNVRVEFPRGLITEWYPQATVTQAVVTPDVLRDPGAPSAIEWPTISLNTALRAARSVRSGYDVVPNGCRSSVVVNTDTSVCGSRTGSGR